MDFIDIIKANSDRVSKLRDQITTEEATKNAFIMPFIQALGYDIFNPSEVVPEFTADVGIKKGEKVDYAIMMEGHPIILIECKSCSEPLDKHSSQLYRYFSVTKARFGILTNGINYKFYTDLEEPNKMDEKPFLEINMLDVKESLISELKKFCKSSYNLDEIISAASELKYTKEIKNIMSIEYANPSENFVKFFASQIHTGRLTQNVLDKYTEITKRAFSQFINEIINERLKSAIVDEPVKQEDEQVQEDTENIEDSKNQIVTTVDELEGYAIVKSILREIIDTKRITYKDTLSYLAILLDNNIRKTICRLYFSPNKKSISFFDENKKEIRTSLNEIDDLYSCTQQIIDATQKFDTKEDLVMQ